jgi:hypothetical protein
MINSRSDILVDKALTTLLKEMSIEHKPAQESISPLWILLRPWLMQTASNKAKECMISDIDLHM